MITFATLVSSCYEEIFRLDDVFEIELQPDHEEEHDRPEVGELAHEIRVADPSEEARSDDEAHEDLADDRRLTYPGRYEVAGEGDHEKETHLELGRGQEIVAHEAAPASKLSWRALQPRLFYPITPK
jgi:hypothetical protein